MVSTSKHSAIARMFAQTKFLTHKMKCCQSVYNTVHSTHSTYSTHRTYVWHTQENTVHTVHTAHTVHTVHTYQRPSVCLAAQRAPFLGVYVPAVGGLAARSSRRVSISFLRSSAFSENCTQKVTGSVTPTTLIYE